MKPVTRNSKLETLRSTLLLQIFGGAPISQKIGAESPSIGDFRLPNADWRLAKVESTIGNWQSPMRRPLEPDTVSTVEGRNSHPMTVPSFLPERFYFGGGFWSAVAIPMKSGDTALDKRLPRCVQQTLLRRQQIANLDLDLGERGEVECFVGA